MKDQDKTKEQLISEVEELRRRVGELEAQVARSQQAEADQQLINHSLPVLVATAGFNGYYTEVNAAFERILGWSEQESLSRPFMEFIHPDDHAAAVDTFGKLKSGKPVTDFLDRNICKDGSHRWINWIVIPLVGREFVFGIGQDITAKKLADDERKRVEEDLRREHRRAQQYLDVAGGIMVVLDNSGNIRLLNRKGYDLLGYDNGDLLGRNWFDTCVPSGIRDEVKSVFGELIAGRVASTEYCDNPVVTRSGEERIIAWHNAVLTDNTGAIVGTLSSGLDITERKRAEEALQAAHDELEERIKERTADLAIFRRFAETSGQGFGMADLGGYLTYLNPALCRLFGVEKPENAIGKHVSTYYGEEYVRRREREILPALTQEGRWQGEEAIRSHHGGTVPILQHSFLIRDEYGNPFRLASVITDITERKQAEETLRQSEEKYRSLVDTSPDGVIMTDLEGRVVFASERVREMHGSGRVEDLLGRNPLDFFAPEDHQRFLTNLRRTIELGITRNIEYSFVRKSGARMDGEVSTAVVKDSLGKPRALVAILRDISERKQAQEALRQSEERYRAVVEGQTEIISQFKADGTLVFVNEVLCRYFGKTSQELLGSKWQPVVLPEDLPMVKEQLRAMSPGNPIVVIENRVYSGLGQVRWVQCVNRGFFDQEGRLTEVQCVGRDITERKQAQEALRQSHDELRAIYNEILDGIIIVNADEANPVRTNSAWCRMLGYSEDESYTLPFERVHPPEVLPLVREHLEAAKKGGIARIDDLPFMRKDGSVVYADVVTSPICYNKRPGWISFFHDVTERHKGQEALERERQLLWRMLQASDHERQVISYEIHDGLAQYLGGAIMQFQAHDALKEDYPDKARKAYETAVELVRQAHFESRRLISEVRPPVIDEIGLEMAISHLVHEQRRRGGPKIKLDSDVQFKRLPSILENSLYRIVQEALTNACKHSKSTKVMVTMTQEGQEVRLEVRDWGIGFDPESVEKGHFGLEGIRQRVRFLDGRLKIESTPGSGTLVQVVVPILEKQNEG